MLIKIHIKAVRPAPVTIVLARRILNSFEVKFSAMMPEPTTTITKKQVPINSAKSFFISTVLFKIRCYTPVLNLNNT